MKKPQGITKSNLQRANTRIIALSAALIHPCKVLQELDGNMFVNIGYVYFLLVVTRT